MRRKAGALLAALLLLVSACTGEQRQAEPGTFAVALSEPGSLLPARVTGLSGRMVAGALWTPLFGHDPKTGTPVPLAAESATSDDQRTWRITLRPGTFHDGTPVTAKSYVDTWNTVLAQRWPGASVLTETLRAQEFRADGERVIELVLERPLGQVPLVLGAQALLPLPASALAAGDWRAFAAHPVGNGPYRLAEPWRPGEGGRLVRFDGHPGPRPGKAKEIHLRVAANPGEQYDLARSGEIDLATEVPGDRHHEMHQDFGDRVLMWPLPELAVLAVPAGEQRLARPAARHAIAMAVDRAAMAKGPLAQQVDPAGALIPPAQPVGHRSGTCRPCTFDPRAATALWEQAGKPAGELPLYVTEGQQAWARPLAEQLGRALGLTVRPRVVPDPAARQDGLAVLTRTLRTASPQELLAPLAARYDDDGFAQMLAEAETTADVAVSGELYRLAENQVLRDLPVIPLWSGHGHAVWSDRISGLAAGGSFAPDLAAVDVPA